MAKKAAKKAAAAPAAPAAAPVAPAAAPAADATAAAPAKRARKPVDLAGFVKRLGVKMSPGAMEKSTKMLRADRFQLFAEVNEDHVAGIVKSQTDAELFYSCRMAKGTYACCTQNLNICGGLRGGPCKHLGVLLVGLAQSGQLDPDTLARWIAGSLERVFPKEEMGQTFIKYKGAQAGEVDWRPTETIPEDYYAL